jgi:transcription-repair coupling factor (superfamily II helicase)
VDKLSLPDMIADSQGALCWSGERLILDVAEDQVVEREKYTLDLLARLEQ